MSTKRNLIETQRQLMKKALDILKQMDTAYAMFSGHSKAYTDERVGELREEYADTMTKLTQLTTKAVYKWSNA